MPVNKERLRLGIAALRSGEFSQCEGSLRSTEYDDDENVIGTSYCCLGVLTEVAIRNGLTIKGHCVGCENPADNGALHNCDHSDVTDNVWELNSSTLSAPVIAWYGFDSEDPSVGLTEPEEGDTAVPMMPATYANDEAKWDFDEIADGFEKVYIYMREDAA